MDATTEGDSACSQATGVANESAQTPRYEPADASVDENATTRLSPPAHTPETCHEESGELTARTGFVAPLSQADTFE